eukprot:CAMPEP_0172364916 /NCGR_PEP_ID=MMETSP1060-20121228/7941_1 /TAXON_ID=37318 /ORGANISM="Pseudo-nitzschia pungens, Strain cf. cingulata" /LENGTH=268 /DNA_ID=CAMNT_0013088045 /DNA_START=41 /DNA_END=847 /DNA_ORIENTATION=+
MTSIPAENANCSKVYLRSYDLTGCYRIDRNVPIILENNNSITSVQWNEFCDEIDNNFLTVNFCKRLIHLIYLCLLISSIAFVIIVQSVETLLAFAAILLTISLVQMYAWDCLDKAPLDRARTICEEESIFISARIGLKHTPVSPCSYDFEFDSEQRPRYANTYIEITVPSRGDTLVVVNALHQAHHNAIGADHIPDDIENPQPAIQMREYVGDNTHVHAIAHPVNYVDESGIAAGSYLYVQNPPVGTSTSMPPYVTAVPTLPSRGEQN